MVTRPVGGILADKISKKVLIIASDVAALAISVVLALVLFTNENVSADSADELGGETQRKTLTILFAASALFGAFGGIQDPAFASSLVELVPQVNLCS